MPLIQNFFKSIALLCFMIAAIAYSASALTAPVLTYPANNSDCIPLTVTLDWNSVPDAVSYHVQLAEDLNFNANKLVDISNLTVTEYQVTLPDLNEDYYWRVSAKDGDGSILWATAFKFNTIEDAPVTVGPANNSYWTFTDPTFYWNTYPGSNNYEIEIYNSSTIAPLNLVFSKNDIPAISTEYHLTTPLVSNKDYWWRMRARRTNCWSAWSQVWKFRTNAEKVVLSAPADDAACLNQDVNFQWVAQDQIRKYGLIISTSSSFEQANIVLLDTNITSNSKAFTLPDYRTEYFWRVKSFFANNKETDWSNTWSLKTRQIGPQPVSPAHNATIDAFTSTFRWTKSQPADNYTMIIDNNSDFSSPEFVFTGLADTFAVATMPSIFNVKYYWKVTSSFTDAFSSCISKDSEVRSFKTQYPAPTLRSPLQGRLCLPLDYRFEWNEVDGVTAYRIQIASDVNFNTIVYDKSNIQDLFQEVTLNTGLKQYWWRVRADDSNNSGVWSPVRNFTTTVASVRLFEPINGSVAQPTTQTFEWQELAANATYTIEIADNPSFNPIEVTATNLTVETFTTTLAKSNTMYYWRVLGKVGDCVQSSAQVWSFRTRIGKPILTQPINNALNMPWAVILRWLELSGSNSYEVEVSLNPNFTSIFFSNAGIPSNFYYLTNLAANTKYYWRIRGRDGNGPGQWSDAFNFTTLEQGAGIPVLTMPTYASVKVPVNVTLKWLASPRADRYRVQIASHEAFKTQDLILDRNNITTNEFALNDLDNYTIYYWRVSAINDSGETRFSEPFWFRTIALPPANAPQLLKPENNRKNMLSAVKFTWSLVNRAEYYTFQISKSESMNPLLDQIPIIYQTEWPITNLEYGFDYFWRAKAINEAGESEWSVIYKFSTENPAGVEDLVSKFSIKAYPNPFSESAQISFNLPESQVVRIDLVDAAGRNIRTLANEFMFAGYNSFNVSSDGLIQGNYWYVITINGEQIAQPLIFVK